MIVTEKQMMEKGIELFREKGYRNVTVDMICSEFHVTKGSFYHHFKSKDELLLKWFYNLNESELFHTEGQPGRNSYEMLKDYFYRWGSMLESVGSELLNESTFALLKTESNTPGNPIAVTGTASSDHLLQLVENAQKDGFISADDDPSRLVNMFSYCVTGLTISWGIEKESISFIDEFMYIFGKVFPFCAES